MKFSGFEGDIWKNGNSAIKSNRFEKLNHFKPKKSI